MHQHYEKTGENKSEHVWYDVTCGLFDVDLRSQ
jgi:hypothetical protein